MYSVGYGGGNERWTNAPTRSSDGNAVVSSCGCDKFPLRGAEQLCRHLLSLQERNVYANS